MDLGYKLKRLPPALQELIKKVSSFARAQEVKVYLVGGIVRDLILGRKNYDLDIAVEEDAIKFCLKLSSHLGVKFRKHHSFGTATIFSPPYKLDLATTRREIYPSWGALPRVEKATLREDLGRRDFTINAMAISLNRKDLGKLIDYFGGLRDLRRGLIRILHNKSFLEDPTRILRAIRFKERFRFKFEPSTLQLLREAESLGVLKMVSPHRIRDELILCFSEDRAYSVIRTISKEVGWKFIDEGLNLKAPDFVLLRKIAKAINWFEEEFPEISFYRWLVYFKGIGRKLSLRSTQVFLSRFGLEKLAYKVLLFQDERKVLARLSKSKRPSQIYKILEPLSFEVIIYLYALSEKKSLREKITSYLKKYRMVKLWIRGDDLRSRGLKPSFIYSRILEKTLAKKLDEGFLNKEEELAFALKEAQRIKKNRI